MHVLIASIYCINTPHFETELEIVQSHLDQGDQVTLLACNASFLSCDVNTEHRPDICLRCIGRRKSGLRSLSKQISVEPVIWLKREDKRIVRDLAANFSKEKELIALQIDGFDIGYGVMSSLISAFREPRPDLNNKQILKTATSMLTAAASTYFSVKRYLATGQYDRVYNYNGRYAIMRAVLRASQNQSVDCFCHEKGGTLDRYSLYKNGLPHDRDIFQQGLEQAWSMANEVERVSISTTFYEERRKAVDQSWFSFVKQQEEGKLPECWNNSKRNIVFFNNSEDEFAAIGRQWEKSVYSSQHEGIRRIVEEFVKDPALHFYLRIHPNLKGVNSSQTRDLATLISPNLTLIPAENTVSSYALLDAAEKVVVFGSTMGIEATWGGVPSILLGHAFYESMGAVYEPKSHLEAVDLIRSDLEPKEKLPALKYGYYAKTFGTKFFYYEAEGIYSGKFKGDVIGIDPFFNYLAKFYSASQYYLLSLLTKVK
ncbi:hypothetical protein ACFL1J_01635 [Pseudomonadota bacterium]